MRDLLKPRISQWRLSNNTWYSYILFENIRRELESKTESSIIFDELLLNNMKIDETLFESLKVNHKIYATRSRISNIRRSNIKPELPMTVTFQLDYTISASQNFIKDEDNLCKIKDGITGDWIEFQIFLPYTLNGQLTGSVAKPRFMKNKFTGNYFGICSYEYKPEKAIGENVLGVDIGQIKLFSAIALDKNGDYSNEFIHSQQTDKLNKKLSKLYEEKQKIYKKILRVDKYNSFNQKQEMRNNQLIGISTKIENLKTNIARNVANEVVLVAKKTHCSKVHIENLSWMGSKGGKWNHSQTHKYIGEACIKAGLKVDKVNAAYSSNTHPITGEQGLKNNRTVKFNDGYEIDRDVLAAVNIASRNKGRKKANKVGRMKTTHTPSRPIKKQKTSKKLIKEFINKIKGDTQIAVFSPQKLKSNDARLWSLIHKVQPKSSLLSYRLLHGMTIIDNF